MSSQKDDKNTKNGIKRRDLFKVLAAGGTAAVAATGCDAPVEKLVPMLVPPEGIEYSPGNAVEFATTCLECPSACSVVVKTREGRAIKAEGNPDNKATGGGLCIRGQSVLQSLYNPQRLKSAATVVGSALADGTWEDVEDRALLAMKNAGGELAYLTSYQGLTRRALINKWLNDFGGLPLVEFEPFAELNARQASQDCFGVSETPYYDFESADLLVDFGADFLETWGQPPEQARSFATMHAVKGTRKNEFVYIAPHVSLTGTNADSWVTINPGTEGMLALTLANLISQASSIQTLSSTLEWYTPERAEEITGIAVNDIVDLAKKLQRARRPLVTVGGVLLASEKGYEAQVAVNVLNYVLGSYDKTVFYGLERDQASASYQDVLDLIARMNRGEIGTLIIDRINPLYSLPRSAGFQEALLKVPNVICLNSILDESAHASNFLLPSLTTLEAWGDAETVKGLYSLIQPVMTPVYELKSAEDTLISLAKKAGHKDYPDSFREYLADAWRARHKQLNIGGNFEDFWLKALQKGVVSVEVKPLAMPTLVLSSIPQQYIPTTFEGEGLSLLVTPSLRHYDGRGSLMPWLQEIPDPISQIAWGSWVDIHPETARELGIRHGEMISLATENGTVEAPAYFYYGIHRGAVGLQLGQGHTAAGKVADSVGVNVLDLLPSVAASKSGQMTLQVSRVKVEGLKRGGEWAMLGGSQREGHRGIYQTITTKQLKDGEEPHYGHETIRERRVNMYYFATTPEGYYEPYRWGMSVDLDRCTGCSACVAACYAENNVPVVGKTRARLGREMSWIRVNRFIDGDAEKFETQFLPMFCQQCGNAGCEPVCPVYATYHNPEGLNAQVYNRCVGTRYCSNNCAYKVRRFNWFNYEFPEPLQMQLNPDVSVRSKGVMEKCTFCVQRIQSKVRDARTEGRLVRDGEIKPACVQTCPTNALVFGNLSDSSHRVTKISNRQVEDNKLRAYKALEELNNQPSVTYLRKVVIDNDEHASING